MEIKTLKKKYYCGPSVSCPLDSVGTVAPTASEGGRLQNGRWCRHVPFLVVKPWKKAARRNERLPPHGIKRLRTNRAFVGLSLHETANAAWCRRLPPPPRSPRRWRLPHYVHAAKRTASSPRTLGSVHEPIDAGASGLSPSPSRRRAPAASTWAPSRRPVRRCSKPSISRCYFRSFLICL